MIRRTAGLLAVAMLAGGGIARVAAQEPIFPDDPRWDTDDLTTGGTAEITGANPFNGNASLELNLVGGLFDWAFYARTAGAPESASWGLLSQVTEVGMAWYREALGSENLVSLADPFQIQSPVLRLLVRDVIDGEAVFSNLVWEYYYNQDGRTADQQFAFDTWFIENLSNQVFWRHLASSDDANKYTNRGDPCGFGPFSSAGELTQITVAGWSECYSPTAQVWGIMVGLGSSWPGAYRGFVDHVRLGFADGEEFSSAGVDLAVWDNFELPDGPVSTVPEPATLVLLGTGLAGLLGAGYVRRIGG